MTQDSPIGIRPFWAATPARTERRGHFWVPGERVAHDGKTYQHGPMFAEWLDMQRHAGSMQTMGDE